MKLKGMVNMALISLFIIAAGYNVYRSQKNINLSDLAKENIEALANSEGGAPIASNRLKRVRAKMPYLKRRCSLVRAAALSRSIESKEKIFFTLEP